MVEHLSAKHFTLPVEAFVRCVYEWLDHYPIDAVLDPNDPCGEQAFQLVRALKGHPNFLPLTAEQAYSVISELRDRRRDPLKSRKLEEWKQDFEVAFYDAWDRVRFPMGKDPVQLACQLVGSGCLKTSNRRPGMYPRFLTVAALLQVEVRRRPILLPVHKLAAHMPCQPKSVSAWTHWAIADGVLVRTASHIFRPGGDSMAAEYVFGLHRWDPPVIERVAALLQVVVTEEDRAWTQRQFSAGRAAS